MKRISKMYELFEDIIAGFFFFTGITLIFYGVVMRYIFKSPVFWVDEISTYVLVWGSILGWSIAQRDGRHIKVTLLYDKLPITTQRWVSVFSRTVSLLFCVFLAYLGYMLETKYFQSHQLSVNTEFPLWIVYTFVSVSALMLGFRYLVELYNLTLKDNGRTWIEERAEEIEMGGSVHHGNSSAL